MRKSNRMVVCIFVFVLAFVVSSVNVLGVLTSDKALVDNGSDSDEDDLSLVSGDKNVYFGKLVSSGRGTIRPRGWSKLSFFITGLACYARWDGWLLSNTEITTLDGETVKFSGSHKGRAFGYFDISFDKDLSTYSIDGIGFVRIIK